jgi:hypothetical protein
MTVPTPRQDPKLWTVMIGTTSFDEALVRSHLYNLKTSSSYDKPKANGRNGATLRYQGEELATFTIRLTASSAEGLNALMTVLAYVRSVAKERGIAVSHPMLAAAGVTAMVIDDTKWPDCSDADVYVVEFSCTQWAPPPKTTKSVTKKISDADLPGDLLTTAKKPKPAAPPKPWEQPVKP